MKNKNLKDVLCVVCRKKEAELLHHIDYEKNVTIPVCGICHKKIHSAVKNPKHYSRSKYIQFAPAGRPTSHAVSILPEHYLKIKNLNRNKSFSGNMRKICSECFDYTDMIQLRIGKYRFTVRKKLY